MNEGLGKDVYRKDKSVKRFRPFTEPPDYFSRKIFAEKRM